MARAKLTESEAGFTDAVIDLAKMHGWRVMHQRPAMRRDGSWRTTIQGHAGFPDLVMAKGGRVVIAELKAAKGKTTPEQDRWLDEFRDVLGVEVYLWKPADWPSIVEALM